MRLDCLPARRVVALLAFAATALGLFAAAFPARAADPINAVPRPLAMAPASAASASTDGALIAGSKRFTESYILGEILRQTAAAAGPAEHREGLGNTAVVLAAQHQRPRGDALQVVVLGCRLAEQHAHGAAVGNRLRQCVEEALALREVGQRAGAGVERRRIGGGSEGIRGHGARRVAAASGK